MREKILSMSSQSAAHSHPESPTPAVLYHEKLHPAWWIWLLCAGFGLSVVLALAPIALWLGISCGIGAAIVCAAIAYLRTKTIVVTDDTLQVGRARIERRFVGAAEAFIDPQDVRKARGPELDARAYMNFSASVGPICRIQITDPVDPTPYWLTSTRKPIHLAEVLNTQTTR